MPVAVDKRTSAKTKLKRIFFIVILTFFVGVSNFENSLTEMPFIFPFLLGTKRLAFNSRLFYYNGAACIKFIDKSRKSGFLYSSLISNKINRILMPDLKL
jgi:hypothetical protein